MVINIMRQFSLLIHPVRKGYSEDNQRPQEFSRCGFLAGRSFCGCRNVFRGSARLPGEVSSSSDSAARQAGRLKDTKKKKIHSMIETRALDSHRMLRKEAEKEEAKKKEKEEEEEEAKKRTADGLGSVCRQKSLITS